MPKPNERKPSERPANNPDMTDEARQLLENELSKPEDEIDTELVNRLLKTLEPAAPDPRRMRKDWSSVRGELPSQQARKRKRRTLERLTAVVAIIAFVLLVPLKGAEAFRWTLIRRLLTPVAETFGIYVNTQATPSPTEAPSYPEESEELSTQISLSSLADVPERYEGYIVRPHWLPGSFAFSAGSVFSNPDLTIYSMDFTDADAWMNFVVHVFTSEEAVSSYEFELTMESPVEAAIGPYEVTYYSNAHSHLQSASWVYENAHYLLIGQMTEEDMFRFIENLQ